jgi:hypothetical protein
MRTRWIAIVLGLTLVVAATAAASAASEPQAAAASSLDFQAVLVLISTAAPCPADVPPNATECRAVTVGSGLTVDGGEAYAPVGELGWVNATYTLPLGLGPPTCPAGLGKPLVTTGRLSVVGKGEIAFVLSEGARCVGTQQAGAEPQEFTITGGTGSFARASGRGTLV